MTTSSIQNGLRKISSRLASSGSEVDRRVFGEKVGFIGKFFGCWHEEISRPFSQNQIAYRSCLKCGARKQFDKRTLETHGAFYFPPIVNTIDWVKN